ncbi:MAG: proteasome endopeptidase complex, archaeal, beta subunit [Thermoprotei archaeon]|nr:MAG: proteasome endopeptidase complex, archaeal, beta subunit [Thermoprotei archaeon]RLF24365.1 MAG: proteasome endopeptidase complex, archaeal, beta subunit [Thermoprotei archaeon]
MRRFPQLNRHEETPFGEYFTPGATVVGLVCKNGVVLASEKRVTYGFYLMSKAGKKLFKINDRLGIACAGIVADMQAIARILAAEARLYELENNRIMPVKAAAKLLSVILFNQRIMPLITETIVGGIDETGPHLFILDPLGSLIEDKYAAVGSGAQIAIGVLESMYKDGMEAESGEKLAVEAVRRAISRDAISGDGVDILVISKDKSYEKFYPVG